MKRTVAILMVVVMLLSISVCDFDFRATPVDLTLSFDGTTYPMGSTTETCNRKE